MQNCSAGKLPATLFMKKTILILALAAATTACNKPMDAAMKSADKDFILKTANEKFQQKKWKDAIALYERVTNLVAGTDDFPNVGFNTAYANYYDGNYKLAGHQFKNFAVNFPQDPRAEEAAYLSALCYYQDSEDYNLDQSSSELAINELQNFINTYPKSERAKNINQLIDELNYKLELKAFENAKQYFKMEDYKAAIVSFENVLDDFPGTKLRQQIYGYLLKSRYELSMNSNPYTQDLKADRLDNAIAYTKQIEGELPNSDLAKTAAEMRAKLSDEKIKNDAFQKDLAQKKATAMAKIEAEQKRTEERQNSKKHDTEIKADSTAAKPAS